MKRLLVLLCLMYGFAHAATDMKIDQQGNPLLAQYGEEGFVDCVFRISDLVDTGAAYRFRITASHAGQTVGMEVTVVKGVQAAFDADAKLIAGHVYRQGVVFSRTGPESDRLLAALSALYGSDKRSGRMVEHESFTAIALHQGSIDMTKDAIKLKLFGRDRDRDHEDDYYETFFNLDLKNGLVYWNEKDPDYRAPLLRALAN